MRRKTLSAFALSLTAAAAMVAGCGSTQKVDDEVITQDLQQSYTPSQVFDMLKAGNERFVNNDLTPRDRVAEREALAKGQYPAAVILGCLDSRVPPELVFDLGNGDAFVGRVAGNFENTDMVGSMEFATALAGSKLIVVLGHSSCGAVMGACDGAEMGNLTATLANIQPAINASQNVPGPKSSSNAAYVAAVTEANVVQTMRDIQSRSPILAERVRNGELMIVGGVYDLVTGRVNWIDG